MNAQTQIVAGSMGAIAQQIGKSLAETFLSAEVIIIVDTSGSMSTMDSLGENPVMTWPVMSWRPFRPACLVRSR
jgi:hypothetical protein